MENLKFLKIWFLLVVVVTALSGLSYLLVQQDIRQSANDPQIQIAWDISSKLTQGVNINKLIPTEKVLIGSELSPFVIIYDYNYNPIAGNGIYDNSLARIPKGVLDYTKEHGKDRVTWQPDTYTRIALIVEKSGDDKSLVAVGRSLREVEVRENMILKLTMLAWFVTIIAITIFTFLFNRKKSHVK